uniref:Uncharacterized protein n=1 Tax=viral metagenome TaxID=1070528 RepID=A0A6M3LGL2_9ZZZZ
MTKYELIITEVAQDVKWLKRQIEANALATTGDFAKILNHLTVLNDRVNKNKTGVALNRYGLIGVFAVTSIIITILLHLMGVY